MRTQRVIETIKLVQTVIEETGLISLIEPRPDMKERDFKAVLGVMTRFSKALTSFEQNPDAIKVLDAFGLGALLHLESLNKLMIDTLATDHRMFSATYSIYSAWNVMRSCVEPIAALTTPAELRAEEPGDILSLQLRMVEDRQLAIQELGKVIAHIQTLYDTFAHVYAGKHEVGRLTLVKIESGSAVEVNMKGAEGIVKELRIFFMEAWKILRYRGLHKIMAQNEAFLSTLDVLQKIDHLQIDDEQKKRFTRAIVENAVKLIGQGVLPAEVQDEEMVNNVQLLQDFSPKLLTGPNEDAESATEPKQARTEQASGKTAQSTEGKGRRKKSS